MDRHDPLSGARVFDDIAKLARQHRLEKFNTGGQYISFLQPSEAGSQIEAQIAKIK